MEKAEIHKMIDEMDESVREMVFEARDAFFVLAEKLGPVGYMALALAGSEVESEDEEDEKPLIFLPN